MVSAKLVLSLWYLAIPVSLVVEQNVSVKLILSEWHIAVTVSLGG